MAKLDVEKFKNWIRKNGVNSTFGGYTRDLKDIRNGVLGNYNSIQYPRAQTAFNEQSVRDLISTNGLFGIDFFELSNVATLTQNLKEFDDIFFKKKLSSVFIDYNENTGNAQPRAAIRKYIEYLEKTHLNKQNDGYSYLDDLSIDLDIHIPNETNHIQPYLNVIFFGPPGTGKTYNTILRAAQIIENRVIDSYDEALNIFKANLHDQIEFITFHQNYSYEDFIQGLRPDISDENGQLRFKKTDGVFKVISDRAYSNLKESKKAPKEINQSKAFAEALEILKDQILESDKPLKINETAYITAVEDDAFRYEVENWILKEKNFNDFRMKYSDLERFFEEDVKEKKEIKNLSNISEQTKQHATYFFKTFELIKSLMPRISANEEKSELKNYVIIIDEINRANISRVFGELITLIEPDKRSHGAIPLEARLPSGDPFIVPSNLYIIGTMNTADKSIALLDIALRRRFEFESMYPKYEITDQVIYDVEILKKINEQIIKSKGHDFQIGHAYFMGKTKNLVNRMNKKVIPLLLEYYMNDEKEVKGIISAAGLKIEENSWPLRIIGKND